MPNRRDVEDSGTVGGWHLKKEIQVSHLVATIAMAASIMFYATKLEQRVALVEQSQAQSQQTQKERDERQDKLLAETLATLIARIDRFEAKMDRLIERKQP